MTNGAPAIKCPIGFIIVPGSATYGTSDFCMMKYEAKQVGTSNVPNSIAAGQPWAAISQTDAKNFSKNVANCTNCHLITEPEWMTIAENVLSVGSNWSNGVVGTGFIYRGHTDGNPNVSIAADTNDTNNTANINSPTANERRTLTLTNGEIIWDLAGNVAEFTDKTYNASPWPGTGGSGGIIQWNTLAVLGNLDSMSIASSIPVNSLNNWTTGNGIGALVTRTSSSFPYAYARGGYYNTSSGFNSSGTNAGVLSLNIFQGTAQTNLSFGFRVTTH